MFHGTPWCGAATACTIYPAVQSANGNKRIIRPTRNLYIEPCAGAPRRRRQFVSAAAADFGGRRAATADNLSARRRCHFGVLNYFVAFFMLCMISLEMVASIENRSRHFSPTIRANVRIAE